MRRRRSWKTSLGGGITAAGSILIGIPLASGIAGASIPSHVLAKVVLAGFLLQAVGAIVNGFYGRDNNRTSEDVGAGAPPAKPTPPTC